MKEAQRYRTDSEYHGVEEADDGDLVLYEDHKAQVDELKRALQLACDAGEKSHALYEAERDRVTEVLGQLADMTESREQYKAKLRDSVEHLGKMWSTLKL